jgi:FAD/FMN-containing dehydrogenase
MRRRILLTGAAGAVVAATPARSAPSAAPTAGDWAALDTAVAGSVERPGTAAYDRSRQLIDPRFDGVRPPAVLRCAHPQDAVEAVGFARRYGLNVVTRGGGHSYVGASTSARALVLDTRALDHVTYDAASRTSIIGGGARLLDVYERLGAHGVSIPAGSCGTVGIGGIALGGGVGLAASAYGLTCDAVVAANIVTGDGRYRTVDARREPALFWALRGGGGGRVGVVTAWRLRTFGVSTVGRFVLTYPWRDAAAVAAGWLARLGRTPDRTWSTCQFSADARGRLAVRISGFTLGADPHADVSALTAAIRRDPASAQLTRKDYLTVVRERAGAESGRDTELVGSDVFAGPLPAAAIAGVLGVVQRRAAQRRPGVAKLKPLTGAVARVAPDATAFPWRRSHSLLQWLVQPPAGDAATVRDAYGFIAAGHTAVARWSSGRYVNYLEPDTAALARYHGPHLAALRRIRAAADPAGTFRSPYAI